jgi:hypothetical protein
MLMIVMLLALTGGSFALYLRYKSRSWLAGLCLFLFVWLVVEVASYGYLLLQAWNFGNVILVGNQMVLDMVMKEHIKASIAKVDRSQRTHLGLDTDLAYVLKPGQQNDGVCNDQMIRSLRNYDIVPPADVFRVAVFGDSFVFCDGEEVADCWTNVVEHSAENLEVMNFGVSGYGLSQSILRYFKEGVRFHPDLIVCNYIIPTSRDRIDWYGAFSGISLRELLLMRVLLRLEKGQLSKEVCGPLDWFDPAFRQRALYGPAGIDLSKELWASPVFSISNVLLVLKNKFAGMHYKDKIKQQLSEEDIEINYTLIKSLIDMARENGAMVLFYCQYPDSAIGEPVKKLIQANQDLVVYCSYPPLLEKYQKQYGVKGDEDVFNKVGHFNAKGNRIFGEAFFSILVSREWGVGERVFLYDDTARRFVLRGK